MQLILASSSLGRKKILSFLKIPFTVIPSTVDEEKIFGKTPLETLELRAKLKGEEVIERITNQELRIKNEKIRSQPIICLILSADSGIILGKELIGKPKYRKEAVKILKKLSGKTHEFVTAIYAIKISKIKNQRSKTNIKNQKDIKIWQDHDRSLVTFRKLSEEDIKLYLSLTDYTKFAGGYALVSAQNFITKVEGSLSNVIGFPLEKIIPILKENKLLPSQVTR